MPRIKHSVCPAYLLEPTPGMHCPLDSGIGTNIFSASLLLAQVLAQFEFATKWLTRKLLRNLATVISAAHVLNEHGGKHHLLQTSSSPMSERFQNSVNV